MWKDKNQTWSEAGDVYGGIWEEAHKADEEEDSIRQTRRTMRIRQTRRRMRMKQRILMACRERRRVEHQWGGFIPGVGTTNRKGWEVLLNTTQSYDIYYGSIVVLGGTDPEAFARQGGVIR